jgi:hypothetical protein
MAHGSSVSIDQATEQTGGVVVSLLTGGAEIRAKFAERSYVAEVAAPQPDQHARTGVPAAIPLAGHAGRLNVLPLLEER